MSNRMDKLAKEINSIKAQVNNMNSPQLAFSSIEDGAINEYDNDGNLVAIIGQQPDGTHAFNPVKGPIPPGTTDPVLVGGSGVIRVKWDGQFLNNNVAPLDFARVEVHLGTEPSFAFDPMPMSTTRAGSIETAGGGEVALIRTAGTYYIKLVTRATTGKYSVPSGEVSVIVDPVVSQQELDQILAEVQAANADLANLQITLGTVQTDLDNAQAILDGIDEIDGRLDNLEIDVTTLDGSVANAQLAADNAVIEAQAASGLASAAQTAADAAATAASNAAAEAGAATQAAQAAEAEVLAIADEVAGKSTVYYGTTPPAGDPNGLWINEGKPYLWDGSNWVVSNDPDLTQAVADAADAKADAAAAQAKADQAALDAAAAQSAAQDAANSAGDALTASQTALGAATAAETAANAAALDSGNAEAASAAASAAAGAAQLAADNALIAAGEASAAADQAEADAANAVTVANSALTTGQNALTQANAAVGTADSALLDAQQAAADAVAAIGTANTATTAAQAAQDAADNANAEALAAAGLAGSKGEVIYQATAPTGSRAVSQNLWIRTSDNKPHTYDTAQSKWVAVTDKTATDAASAAASANSLAGNAWTLANTANSQANTATSLANTAQAAADTAQSAANAAQGAADDANDAALDAAGLAGSKGKVIYSATAPTGADKVAQNLWIRTTDNKPHTLVNGVWTAITDKAATDAATDAATAQSTANTAKADAATAQSKADTAWNLANTANGTANTALSTANGKNKVTYSLNAPGTAANTAGDIWFRKDSNNVIIGQWEGLGGTSWAQRTIGNTVIANLDAGKITSGYIDAARINAGTITVGMIKPGDVATPAQVTATANAAAADAAAAAELAAKQYADGEIDAAALATAQAAAADAQDKADAAQAAAIAAAEADATAKANAAQTAAVNTAALDAQTKADAAKTAAELAAKQYADGAISTSEYETLQAAALDAQDKADAAEAAAVLAAGQQTESLMAPLSDTLTLWQYPNGTLIDGGKIYTNTITANQIATGAITADELAANAVTATKILAGAVTAGKIDTDAVTANTIAANAVTAGKINADAITAREIAANAVTAEQIKANAVVAGKIAADAVTAGTIAADAVAAGTIAADAITGREINALAIDTEHLVSGAIVADKIAAGAIIADKIAVNAITTEKIVALAIVGDKIAANAISADKITANAITSDKIVANAVIADKIAANAVTADKIAANAVTADKIKAGEINVGHLAAGTLSADNLTAGTINASIGIATTGAIIAGDFDGVAAELESTGLNVYILEDEDGNTTLPGTRRPFPMISLGSQDENALAITSGRTPEAMASLSADGAISGEHLAVGNDPQFNGQLLMGAWAYRSTDASGDRDSILWNQAWGIQGDTTMLETVAGGLYANPGTSQLMVYDTWKLFAGRAYRFNVDPLTINTASTTTTSPHAIIRFQKTQVDGFATSPPVPSLATSENIFFARVPVLVVGTSSVLAPASQIIQPSRDETASIALSLSGISTRVEIDKGRMYLEDLGPAGGYTGGVAYPQSSSTPVTSPLKKYTYYFYPASVDLQQGPYNSNFTWSGVPQTDKAIQGWNVSVSGSPAFHTNVRFGTSLSASGSSATGLKLAQVVAGAQTVEAKLRVTSAWSERSSVRAKIGWGQTDSNGPTTKVTSSPISPGGTTTVSLGTEGGNYIKTYASGDDFRIYVGPGTQGSNVDLMALYAMAGSSSQKMRLQVDVWK